MDILDDVFDLTPRKFAPANSLAVIAVRLELTLNYPNTAPFLKLSEEETKRLYIGLFDYIRYRFPQEKVYSHEHTFEKCKNGRIHLHGYIDMCFDHAFYPKGLVMDAVHAYFSQLPKRSQSQLANNHYSETFQVFKSPAILIQYTKLSDFQRKADWEEYIIKNAPK